MRSASRTVPIVATLAILVMLLAMSLTSAGAQPQEGSPASGNAGKKAASITYIKTQPHFDIPDDYVAPSGGTLDFYDITTLDGYVMPTAYFDPGTSPDETTLVLSVHGSGGSYLSNTPRILAPDLAAHGYAVLAITTRQSNQTRGVNTDQFFDIQRDIEAALEVAKDLGYETVVLHGQSLGNIHVQMFTATRWDPVIEGVVMTSPFSNLPWKSRYLLIQDEENYHQLFEEAMQAMADGEPDRVLDTEMGWISGGTVPVTAQHFLTYRWEEAGSAVGVWWIKRVPQPILLVYGTADAIVRDFEPRELVGEATSEGSLVPSIDFEEVEGAGHGFGGHAEPLREAVRAWLADQGL